MNIAIVCGSVPSVKPLFTLLFPSLNFKVRSQSGGQRMKSSSPIPNTGTKTSAKSWNPLNTLRKYGQSMSVLNNTVMTRNDVELESGQQGKSITIERTVDQTSVPVCEGDASSQRRLMHWEQSDELSGKQSRVASF